MSHFKESAWVDFVRNAADPAIGSDILKHLAEPCTSCTRSLEVWTRVMAMTQELARLEPPQASIQAVRAGLRLSKALPASMDNIQLAVLQFDSSRQASAAGVRSAHATARQLLYRSGSVCIDMRMQPTPGSESVLLLGQLLDSMNPGHGIGGIPVSLLSKGDTVSKKSTNDAGEFDFGLKPMREIQLVFGIEDTRTIVVSVPEGALEATKASVYQ